MKKIDHKLGVPVYEQVKQIVLEKIKSSRIGERLPSDKDLAGLSGASYVTVQKAVNELAREGYLQREVGRGTFVREPEDKKTILKFQMKGKSSSFSILEACLHWAEEVLMKKTKGRVSCYFSEAPRKNYENHRVDLWKSSDFDLAELDGVVRYFESMHAGVFLPLNQFLEKAHIDVLGHFSKDYLRHFSRNGTLYAATAYYLPSILIFNKSVFDTLRLPYPDASLNWRTFLNLCESIQRESKVQAFQMGRFLPFIFQNEGELFSPDGRECLVDSPACEEALEYYLRLLRLEPASPALIGFDFWDYYAELFTQGRLAMRLGTPLEVHFFENQGLSVGVAPLPVGKKRATVLTEQSYAIRSGTPQAEAAGHFLGILLSETVQKRIADETYFVPSSVGVQAQKIKENPDPVRSAIYESLSYGRFLPETRSGLFNESIRSEINQTLLGKKTLRQGLRDLREKMNREISIQESL